MSGGAWTTIGFGQNFQAANPAAIAAPTASTGHRRRGRGGAERLVASVRRSDVGIGADGELATAFGHGGLSLPPDADGPRSARTHLRSKDWRIGAQASPGASLRPPVHPTYFTNAEWGWFAAGPKTVSDSGRRMRGSSSRERSGSARRSREPG